MSAYAKISERIRPVHKAIKLKAQYDERAREIASRHGLGPIAARVLAARGFCCADDLQSETLKTYLNPTLKDGLPQPGDLVNLNAACDLIAKIARKGKPIAICCDFDVDGLSGGAQLHHFLTTSGISNRVFVPDRFADGYGLNEGMIRTIADEGFGLIITIDYGTTNTKELELARKLKIPTIVIDHHHVGEIRCAADVFVNPNQTACGFAGGVLSAAGLAWYLLLGLRRVLPSAEALDPKSYLDLACLGTICDMVPLCGANRVIAKRGLELMGSTKRPGLQALKNVSSIKNDVSCYDVSFGIGPRINAAGRMVHGELVIELLTTADSRRAEKLAQRLNKLNLERQDTEARVKEHAVRQIEQLSSLPAALVVGSPEYHTGVIGIVAQRLVEIFYRPTVVMGVDKPGIFKGSVRGIKGLSVVETLAAVGEHLTKFGGHHGAGGFSLQEKQLVPFTEAFIAECERKLKHIDAVPTIEADTEVTLAELDLSLVDELKRFAPFGIGNPGPMLLARDLKVHEVRSLKDSHLKVTFSQERRFINGMLWRCREHPDLQAGAKVDVAFKPDRNNFGGLPELQMTIQAVTRARTAQSA